MVLRVGGTLGFCGREGAEFCKEGEKYDGCGEIEEWEVGGFSKDGSSVRMGGGERIITEWLDVFWEFALWLCNCNILEKLSYCLLIAGASFRINRASLIANLYLSGALAIIVVFSVSSSLVGFLLCSSMKWL